MSADNGGVGADGRAFFHECFLITRAALGILSAGREVIGENAGRPAEHIVFQFHALVEGDIVLYFAAVADFHMVADVDVLPQRAALADARAPLDVAEMPDLRGLANLNIIVDVRTFADEIVFFRHHSASRTAVMTVSCSASVR